MEFFFHKYQLVYLFIHKLDRFLFFFSHSARVKGRDYPKIEMHYIYIYIYIYQRGNTSTLNGSSLKLVDKFTYLGSSVSSTKTDINTRLAKAWTAIDRLSVIWKSDLTDKIKLSFYQVAVISIVLYGC